MKEISRRIRLLEKYPPMKSPLVEQLGYDVMSEEGYEIILVTVIGQDKGNTFTRDLLRQLKAVMGTLTEK